MRKARFGTTAVADYDRRVVAAEMFLAVSTFGVFAPAEIGEGCECATGLERFVAGGVRLVFRF